MTLLTHLSYPESHGQLRSHKVDKLTAQSMVDSVLPYFDLSVQLAGVQYEYINKQTVYGTPTIQNI